MWGALHQRHCCGLLLPRGHPWMPRQAAPQHMSEDTLPPAAWLVQLLHIPQGGWKGLIWRALPNSAPPPAPNPCQPLTATCPSQGARRSSASTTGQNSLTIHTELHRQHRVQPSCAQATPSNTKSLAHRTYIVTRDGNLTPQQRLRAQWCFVSFTNRWIQGGKVCSGGEKSRRSWLGTR